MSALDLVYRKESPAEPGFWWLLDDAGVEQVVEVVELAKRHSSGPMQETDELVVFAPGDGNGWRRLSDCRAVGWAGPISKPRKGRP